MRTEQYMLGLQSLLVQILFLCFAAALVSTGLFASPGLLIGVLIAALVVIVLLVVSIVVAFVRRPYDRIFESEDHASETLKQHIDNHSKYEALRIAGASCTSIFSLFDVYVGAMAVGKRLYVCMLDPHAADIIQFLRDCEPDRDQVIQKVRENLETIRPRVSSDCYEEVHALVSAPDAYGSKLIHASALLWKEANRRAKGDSGYIPNGLEIFHYTHLPTLKAWIFGESVLFIGGYSPMPGGAGINNPVYRLTNRRSKQHVVIQGSRRAFAFLKNHQSTRSHA